ncbi:hypothetical protein KAFR_0H02640 [Kazachstania africana CBS 2517]|uniref:Uncharacterized protein n=1 Tax=Kazachstania africana (strain ATCC 22294 / BCRC 22015 / CBS 2517 / CECT 1963 / NBRC 1671 / NRRL Y-8276) TaxID=1071382 RepID=H2AZB7_KAZAF|nr:hypothetical protein KAFR_0H02640 [Kazachstania africana CBS 2517]CCF59673.1 hypothetical protein KAFR_0H02640 [Kazachstania africana CBS 2517]
MWNQLSIILATSVVLAKAETFQAYLTTEDVGGDSTELNRPLTVHLDKNTMSAELLEKLQHTSNIVFADLPQVPEFVTLKEYEEIFNKMYDEEEDTLYEEGKQFGQFADDEGEEIEQYDAVIDISKGQKKAVVEAVGSTNKTTMTSSFLETSVTRTTVTATLSSCETSTTQRVESTTSVTQQSNFTSGNVTIIGGTAQEENSSTFVTPATMFMAVLLGVLVFVQAY